MGNASAAEIHVHHGDSIQDAINMANPEDTIIVYPGTYTENVDIDKELKIISDSGNPDDVTVQAVNPNDHVFHITADNVTIKGLTLTGATRGSNAGIFLDGVNDCIIVNNELSKNSVGISLWNSRYNTLNNNSASNNYHGIEMVWSNDNTLSDNIVQNNNLGICLVYSNNNVLNNTDSSSNRISGIHLVTSSDNNLNNNIASGNAYGIYLDRSHNNKLSSCNISNNNKGIELRNSIKNTLDSNTLSNNKKGIELQDASSRNRLFQNDFINNDWTIFSNIYNLWNTTKPITYYYNSNSYTNYLGNFYSDHTGNNVNSDGVSDIPYRKYDNYPLMSLSVDYVIGDTKSTLPFVDIISPVDGSSHTTHNVNLTAICPTATWMWYSLDKGTNSTHSNGTKLEVMLTGLSEGKHVVMVYARDANDNVGKTSAEFYKVREDAEAATIYVGNDNNADYTSIQEAIDNAIPGDIILVYPGTYTENVDVDKTLMIISQTKNPEDTIVQAADNKDHVFHVTANNVTISGFSVKDADGFLSTKVNRFDVGGIYLDGANGCIVTSNILSNNMKGIYLQGADNNILSDNIVSSSIEVGIWLYNSSNNILDNNTGLNSWTGIHFIDSTNNRLRDNTVANNEYGIAFLNSTDNILIGNNASTNKDGILLIASRNNTLESNTAKSNKQDGFSFAHSNNNILTGNIISDSSGHGIRIRNSNNNTIYNNHFNNTNNVRFEMTNVGNLWNIPKTAGSNIVGGNYLGGNFWANPNGTGFSQTHEDANGDGICDLPYSLNENNADKLPILIKTSRQMAVRELPTSPVEPGEKFTVHITKLNDCLFSQVVETIPSGFSYAGSTLDSFAVTEDGNEVSFILFQESSFEYTLIAPDIEGTYKFSGIIRDEDLREFPIDGDFLIVIERET